MMIPLDENELEEVSFSSTPGKAFLKGVRSYRELMKIWERIGEGKTNERR